MFVLNQRVFILSNSSTILRRFFVNKDNKIRINKSNVYYEDRIDLKNQLIQINFYFIFYFILTNKKIIFALTFFKERA